MHEKVLVIGSGGREHALGWKISQENCNVYIAPGNGGTRFCAENVDIHPDNIYGLVTYAQNHGIDLTIVGPEVPLADGIVNKFRDANLLIFGPTAEAAQLESSKIWTAKFMKKYGIPHPSFEVFDDATQALLEVEKRDPRTYVIKADGLAAGKGVIVPDTKEEAREAIEKIMVRREFGDAGDKVLFQERLTGPEVSVLAFTDGEMVVAMPPAQDHKRVFDDDKGPNTGGMGAYAPVPLVDDDLLWEIKDSILQPTIEGMKQDGHSYTGVLYAGLMLTKHGPKVLEYNCRFGDPEAQPLLTLLDSSLVAICHACITGGLTQEMVRFRPGFAVCVVLAAQGYPDGYAKGAEIIIPQSVKDTNNVHVFHAGTLFQNDELVTNGGRVLGITAYEETLQDAVKLAYSVIGEQGVYFQGMHYRRNIGKFSG